MTSIPRQVAGYLKERLELTADEEEVALYTLEVIFYGLLNFLGMILAGWLLGCLKATIIIAVTIFILRCFSGGAHSNSPGSCFILSIIIVALLGKLVLIAAPFLSLYALAALMVIGFVFSFFINWRLSPVDTPAKPVASERHRRQLKRLSVLTVLLVFVLQGGIFFFVGSVNTFV